MKKISTQEKITFNMDLESKNKIDDHKAMIKKKYGSLNKFYNEAINKEFADLIKSPYDSTVNFMTTSKITHQTYNLIKKLKNDLDTVNNNVITLWKKVDHVAKSNAEQQSINNSQIKDEPIKQETIDYYNEMEAEFDQNEVNKNKE